MLHLGHQGWGRFTSSKTTTLSRTLWCRKCTRIAFIVASCTGHPSTRQLCGTSLAGTAMQYVRSSSPMAEVFQLHISSTACPCFVIIFPVNDSAAISSPNSLHCTCFSAAPGSRVPLPSSVARTPPLAGYPLPCMGGRPCRLSSWHYSVGLPYLTGQPGY